MCEVLLDHPASCMIACCLREQLAAHSMRSQIQFEAPLCAVSRAEYEGCEHNVDIAAKSSESEDSTEMCKGVAEELTLLAIDPL